MLLCRIADVLMFVRVRVIVDVMYMSMVIGRMVVVGCTMLGAVLAMMRFALLIV